MSSLTAFEIKCGWRPTNQAPCEICDEPPVLRFEDTRISQADPLGQNTMGICKCDCVGATCTLDSSMLGKQEVKDAMTERLISSYHRDMRRLKERLGEPPADKDPKTWYKMMLKFIKDHR